MFKNRIEVGQISGNELMIILNTSVGPQLCRVTKHNGHGNSYSSIKIDATGNGKLVL